MSYQNSDMQIKYSVLLVRVLSLFLSFSFSVHAEIYKYQDSDGSWRFSDTPPADQKVVEKLHVENEVNSIEATDLKEKLAKRYSPKSAAEKATLSVVKVETPISTGSGFFVSESGLLITNKHVVRPSESFDDEKDRQFENTQSWLQRRKSYITERKDYQKSWKLDLKEYYNYYRDYSSAENSQYLKEYNRRKNRYQTYAKETERLTRDYRERLAEHNDYKRSFNSRRSSAAIALQFDVILKNDQTLKANLIKLSDKYDLALLKVEGYRVPAMVMPKESKIRQADKVYAIGSPLGRKDYITSGIVTSIKHNKIVMDAHILPGNSGGPLIDEDSNVVGVNTWKRYTRPGSMVDGFGIAIAASAVYSEFGKYLIKDKEQQQLAQEASVEATLPIGEKNKALLESILKDYQSTQ